MSRIAPPSGYITWNQYIEAQANASPDQSIVARRLIKRNIKLSMIASEERYASGDTTSPSWRVYNDYESPGTMSPAIGHPWLTDATDHLSQFQSEDGVYTIATEDSNEITAE
jgi:Ni/Co efflux regulator RcnB